MRCVPMVADVTLLAGVENLAPATPGPESECLHRVVQRPVAGRVSERALVLQSRTCQGGHRDLARGVQRGASEERIGWSHAISIRQATGSTVGYINHRTPDLNATETGVTS